MENTDTGNNYTVENGKVSQNGNKTLIEGKESGERSNLRLHYQRDGSRVVNLNIDDGYVELTEANDTTVVNYISEENGHEGGIVVREDGDGGCYVPEDEELPEGMAPFSGKATETNALGHGDSVDRVDAVLDDEVPGL